MVPHLNHCRASASGDVHQGSGTRGPSIGEERKPNSNDLFGPSRYVDSLSAGSRSPNEQAPPCELENVSPNTAHYRFLPLPLGLRNVVPVAGASHVIQAEAARLKRVLS